MLTQLEDNLIIDLEEGTKRYESLAVEARNYQEMQDVLTALAVEYRDNGEKPVRKYLTLDTLDELENIAVHKAAEMYKATPMGKSWYAKNYVKPGVLKPEGEVITSLPNGGGWGYMREAMKWYVEILKKFCKYLLLVSHVKDKRIMGLEGSEEVIVKDISLTGKMGSILAAKADAIGYAYRTAKGELMLSFKTNENSIMGSRCPHLAGQVIPFEWDKIFID
jgi:hypothetical protein